MIFSYKTSKQPHDSHHVSHSEVSCRDTVRQARITRVKSKGVRKLGKVKLKRSESGAHHVFRKFGASLEIKLSKTNLPTKNGFPYVSFTNWVRYLMEYDRLEHLVGVRDEKLMKKTLGTFWDRLKERNPEHVAFTRGPSFPLDSLIPVLFHGDEGRGLKKKQIMVLSTHGLLGKGSSRHPKASAASEDPLKMNYKGNTWKNHFLLCCMPVSLYGDDPSALFQMLDIQAEEFSRLFWDGVEFGGRRLYVACVGIKGDSPFLSKAGMFNRAFTRRPTRSSSKTPCKGDVIFAWQAANLMTMMYHTRNLEMNFHLGWVQWAWWNRMKHHPHFWRFLFIGVEPRKLCLSSTCSTTSTKALGRILQLLRFAFVWNLWETPLAVPLTSWHQTSSSTALKKRSPPITKRSQRNWLELKLVSRIGRMQHGVKEISRDWFFSGSVITAKGVLLDTRWTHCTWNASLKFECW